LHILPGAAAVSAPDRPPWVDYKVYIQTLGAYTLFLRLSGADTSSDSIYAQIVELGGPRLFSGNSSADFSNSWQTAASNPSWVVTQPGLYTVRVSCSQSGAALDAVCLQLAGLPAPAEPGPAESSVATNLPPLLLTSQSPAPNQTGVYPTASVTAQVLDTVLPSDASLYTMWVDGSQVAPTMAKAGSVTSFSFTPATQMALGSAHSVTLLYQDSSPLMGNWTNSWNFTVSATQPPPTFTSTSCARGILSLSWVGGGTLQSTSSLVPPVVWNNVTTNGTFAEPAIGAKFYRLVH
jgi:hypothetical protein